MHHRLEVRRCPKCGIVLDTATAIKHAGLAGPRAESWRRGFLCRMRRGSNLRRTAVAPESDGGGSRRTKNRTDLGNA